MVKIHSDVIKFICHITELILLIAIATMIRNANGTDIVCMDLSLCNLVKGDLSQESPVLKSESSKFYKMAEDNLVSNKTICEGELTKCIDDVTTMAIDILQFPKKYKKVCNHKSYSRSLFACKNRINWPKSVANKLPERYTSCLTDCLINEDQPYKLSNGKFLLDYKFPFPNVTTDDVKFDVSKPKSTDTNRTVTRNRTAFEDEDDGLTWTSIDSCPENTWGNLILEVHYEQTLHAMQNIIVYCSHLNEENKHIDIIQTAVGNWKRNESLVTSKFDCETHFIPLRGIQVKTTMVGGKPVLHSQLMKLCKDKPVLPGPGLLDCENSEGICTIQAKNIDYLSYLFIKNIRIGCCDLTPEEKLTTTNSPPITPTTPGPPTLTDEIFNLQKIMTYVFWDDDAVHNGIITRFNEYVTPSFIPNQDVWSTSKCPTGTFLNGFSIMDSKACYYQGIRVMEINIRCGTRNGTGTIELDLYNSTLKNGHTLQDNKLLYNSTCTNGYYNNMELTYFVDKRKTYMVRAWGFGMKCSESSSLGPHKHIFNPLSDRNVKLTEYNEVRAISQCKNGMGLCGIQKKIIHEGRGTFEGLFIKIICCDV